jgi:hypothetical protein
MVLISALNHCLNHYHRPSLPFTACRWVRLLLTALVNDLPPNTTSLHLASTVMIYHTLWMLFIQIRDEAKHTRVLKDYSMQSGICLARYLRRYHHTYLHSVWRKMVDSILEVVYYEGKWALNCVLLDISRVVVEEMLHYFTTTALLIA